mgnify:CR=1 FL=1
MYQFPHMIRFISAAVFVLVLSFVSVHSAAAQTTGSRLSGRILLQVQDKGQAWYVNPSNQQAYYMGRPSDAFELMKRLGTGITDANLRKIPVAPMNYFGTPDMDRDGLSDSFERVYGTDMNNPDTDYDGLTDSAELRMGATPFGMGAPKYDMAFANAQKGKIFIQVQRGGAAWYINPVDLKAYYLGKPPDAFNVMRALGLGVTNETLAEIQGQQYAISHPYAPYGASGPYDYYMPYNPSPAPVAPYYASPAPYYPTPAPSSPRWYVRIYNVDDVATTAINGALQSTIFYGGDSGFVDITNMIHSGNNSVTLKVRNTTGGYTWGFQIKRDNTIVFDEKAGIAGSYGANNNDGNRQYQDVYNKNIIINGSGITMINSLLPY